MRIVCWQRIGMSCERMEMMTEDGDADGQLRTEDGGEDGRWLTEDGAEGRRSRGER